jgi:hypothetical protein
MPAKRLRQLRRDLCKEGLDREEALVTPFPKSWLADEREEDQSRHREEKDQKQPALCRLRDPPGGITSSLVRRITSRGRCTLWPHREEENCPDPSTSPRHLNAGLRLKPPPGQREQGVWRCKCPCLVGASVAAFDPRDAASAQGIGPRRLELDGLPPFQRIEVVDHLWQQPYSEPPDRSARLVAGFMLIEP